jgi:hypothetical protein
MPSAVFYASERSSIQSNAPTSAEVGAAFRAAQVGDGSGLDGAWVGPAPRVTRDAPFGAFVTYGAWLYEWPEDPRVYATLQARQRHVREKLALALSRQSPDWSAVSVEEYAPRLHGPMIFWTSGEAANTMTRDEFPTGFGRTAPIENSTGPTTNSLPRLREVARNVAAAARHVAAPVLAPIALGAGAGALLFFAPQALRRRRA